MTSITPEWGSDKIAYNLTGPEVTFIEQARRAVDRYMLLVTTEELAFIVERRLMTADYKAYAERCDLDEALGYRDAS